MDERVCIAGHALPLSRTAHALPLGDVVAGELDDLCSLARCVAVLGDAPPDDATWPPRDVAAQLELRRRLRDARRAWHRYAPVASLRAARVRARIVDDTPWFDCLASVLVALGAVAARHADSVAVVDPLLLELPSGAPPPAWVRGVLADAHACSNGWDALLFAALQQAVPWGRTEAVPARVVALWAAAYTAPHSCLRSVYACGFAVALPKPCRSDAAARRAATAALLLARDAVDADSCSGCDRAFEYSMQGLRTDVMPGWCPSPRFAAAPPPPPPPLPPPPPRMRVRVPERQSTPGAAARTP